MGLAAVLQNFRRHPQSTGVAAIAEHTASDQSEDELHVLLRQKATVAPAGRSLTTGTAVRCRSSWNRTWRKRKRLAPSLFPRVRCYSLQRTSVLIMRDGFVQKPQPGSRFNPIAYLSRA